MARAENNRYLGLLNKHWTNNKACAKINEKGHEERKAQNHEMSYNS